MRVGGIYFRGGIADTCVAQVNVDMSDLVCISVDIRSEEPNRVKEIVVVFRQEYPYVEMLFWSNSYFQ